MEEKMEIELRKKVEKGSKMESLLLVPEFQELILDEYITLGMEENVLHENLNAEETILNLKSIQNLNAYIYGIIEEAKKAKEILRNG